MPLLLVYAMLYLYSDKLLNLIRGRNIMKTKRESSEKGSKTTEPGSSAKIMEGYIKEWMNGNREISKENLRVLANCKNDDELAHLLKKGHLSL
jgi:hypothetical protein